MISNIIWPLSETAKLAGGWNYCNSSSGSHCHFGQKTILCFWPFSHLCRCNDDTYFLCWISWKKRYTQALWCELSSSVSAPTFNAFQPLCFSLRPTTMAFLNSSCEPTLSIAFCRYMNLFNQSLQLSFPFTGLVSQLAWLKMDVFISMKGQEEEHDYACEWMYIKVKNGKEEKKI